MQTTFLQFMAAAVITAEPAQTTNNTKKYVATDKYTGSIILVADTRADAIANCANKYYGPADRLTTIEIPASAIEETNTELNVDGAICDRLKLYLWMLDNSAEYQALREEMKARDEAQRRVIGWE